MAVRLYVGGLPMHICEDDLASRFKPFGTIINVEILPAKQGHLPNVSPQELLSTFHPTRTEKFRGIAYVELEPKDATEIQKCIKLYNHSKWRGSELRVEPAQPSYLQRLQGEWQTDAAKEEQAAQDAAAKAALPQSALIPPADLTQPLNYPIPRCPWKTFELPLTPSKPPRRSFPAVPEKPISALSWEYNEGARAGSAVQYRSALYKRNEVHGLPPQKYVPNEAVIAACAEGYVRIAPTRALAADSNAQRLLGAAEGGANAYDHVLAHTQQHEGQQRLGLLGQQPSPSPAAARAAAAAAALLQRSAASSRELSSSLKILKAIDEGERRAAHAAQGEALMALHKQQNKQAGVANKPGSANTGKAGLAASATPAAPASVLAAGGGGDPAVAAGTGSKVVDFMGGADGMGMGDQGSAPGAAELARFASDSDEEDEGALALDRFMMNPSQQSQQRASGGKLGSNAAEIGRAFLAGSSTAMKQQQQMPSAPANIFSQEDGESWKDGRDLASDIDNTDDLLGSQSEGLEEAESLSEGQDVKDETDGSMQLQADADTQSEVELSQPGDEQLLEGEKSPAEAGVMGSDPGAVSEDEQEDEQASGEDEGVAEDEEMLDAGTVAEDGGNLGFNDREGGEPLPAPAVAGPVVASASPLAAVPAVQSTANDMATVGKDTAAAAAALQAWVHKPLAVADFCGPMRPQQGTGQRGRLAADLDRFGSDSDECFMDVDGSDDDAASKRQRIVHARTGSKAAPAKGTQAALKPQTAAPSPVPGPAVTAPSGMLGPKQLPAKRPIPDAAAAASDVKPSPAKVQKVQARCSTSNKAQSLLPATSATAGGSKSLNLDTQLAKGADTAAAGVAVIGSQRSLSAKASSPASTRNSSGMLAVQQQQQQGHQHEEQYDSSSDDDAHGHGVGGSSFVEVTAEQVLGSLKRPMGQLAQPSLTFSGGKHAASVAQGFVRNRQAEPSSVQAKGQVLPVRDGTAGAGAGQAGGAAAADTVNAVGAGGGTVGSAGGLGSTVAAVHTPSAAARLMVMLGQQRSLLQPPHSAPPHKATLGADAGAGGPASLGSTPPGTGGSSLAHTFMRPAGATSADLAASWAVHAADLQAGTKSRKAKRQAGAGRGGGSGSSARTPNRR